MKAIYIKPETEVVYLLAEEDIAEFGQFGKNSVNEDRASGNSGFFGDDSTIGDKNTFFDD